MPWSAPRRPSCSPPARRHSCRSRTSTLSRGSPTMSSSCSSRCPIRSACSAGLVLVRAVPAGEQGPPQAEAVTAIAKIGGDPGADALRGILGTGSTAGVPTSLAQSTALLEAWRLGTRAPVPSLLGFADDPDLNARWHALYALARLRGARGVPALLRALDDSSALVRAVAVRGVSRALVDSARLDPQTVVGRLRPLFADRDPQVRINALRALATFRDTALSRLAAPLAG